MRLATTVPSVFLTLAVLGLARHRDQKIARGEAYTVGIRWWSPTQLLVYQSDAYIR